MHCNINSYIVLVCVTKPANLPVLQVLGKCFWEMFTCILIKKKCKEIIWQYRYMYMHLGKTRSFLRKKKQGRVLHAYFVKPVLQKVIKYTFFKKMVCLFLVWIHLPSSVYLKKTIWSFETPVREKKTTLLCFLFF